MLAADKSITEHLKKDNYTIEELKSILTTNATLGNYKMVMIQVLSNTTHEEFAEGIEEFKDYIYDQLNYNLNLEYDGRKILGDDADDFSTKYLW